MEGDEVFNTDKAVDSLSTMIRNSMVFSFDRSDWEEAAKDMEWAVLLRPASGKILQRKSLEELLNKVWKLSEPAMYHKVEKNTFLIVFKSKEDQEKVLMGGPWSYDGNVLLLQKWEAGMVADDFNCTTFKVWIQIHGLPFELRNETYARRVAEGAGKVLNTHREGRGSEAKFSREYMRFRIEVDVTRPIVPGFFLQRINRPPIWIPIKYEKLPNLCFTCGMFTHETKVCKEQSITKRRMFGTWIKAEEQTKFNLHWSEIDPADSTFMVLDCTTSEIQSTENQKSLTLEKNGGLQISRDKIKNHGNSKNQEQESHGVKEAVSDPEGKGILVSKEGVDANNPKPNLIGPVQPESKAKCDKGKEVVTRVPGHISVKEIKRLAGPLERKSPVTPVDTFSYLGPKRKREDEPNHPETIKFLNKKPVSNRRDIDGELETMELVEVTILNDATSAESAGQLRRDQ